MTLWTLGIGALLLLILATSYLVRGETVPRIYYVVVAGSMLVGGLIALMVHRCSVIEASCFPDDAFRSGSRLAESLLANRLEFPAGKSRRVVLISDGQETHNEIDDALSILQEEGIKVY